MMLDFKNLELFFAFRAAQKASRDKGGDRDNQRRHDGGRTGDTRLWLAEGRDEPHARRSKHLARPSPAYLNMGG